MRTSSITISSSDYNRLLTLVDSARLDRRIPAESLDLLERELSRALIVDSSQLPEDVVAMNSTVWFRELDSDEIEKYTLVYPAEADVIHDRISVLAPIGTALLGYRTGDIVQWRVPSGKRRFQIVNVVQNAIENRFEDAVALV
jgi:regulator of nucleoside diphosphate kinase